VPATKTKRTHIVISHELANEIDSIVGKGSRSTFLVQAAERELMRLRQLKALKAAVGIWKDEDHPELKDGAYAWVRKLRSNDGPRFEKAQSR
jgi:hypothetical protein